MLGFFRTQRRHLALPILFALLVAGEAHAAPPGRYRIVIDPGHGGTLEGAQGPGGVLEKNVALAVAVSLKRKFETELGATVLLTRSADRLVQLAERVSLANKFTPDLFISVHANSMPTRLLRQQTEGVETFFLSADASDDAALKTAVRENAESPQVFTPDDKDLLGFILEDLARADAHVDSSHFAHSVQRELVRATNANDRGVHQAPFYVLTGVGSPAILVEMGYVSHPKESRRLMDAAYREQVVTGIFEGTKRFLETKSPSGRAGAN